MRIRSATSADLPACHAVWLSAAADLANPTGAGQVESDVTLPLHEHELRTGRLVVAEGAGSGGAAVVGFGATLTRTGVAYVADLFVRPEHQDRGVGRSLLAALLDDHRGPRFTLASSDPRARRLYAAFGMHPVALISYLRAAPDNVAFDRLEPGGIHLAPGGVSEEVLALDRAVTRRDRHLDLEHADDQLGAVTFVGSRADHTIGYVQLIHPAPGNPAHPDAVRVGPVVALDPHDTAPLLAAALLATRDLATTWLAPFVPASHPAHDQLVAAGFHVDDTDLLMASDPALIDRDRYFPAVDTA